MISATAILAASSILMIFWCNTEQGRSENVCEIHMREGVVAECVYLFVICEDVRARVHV